MLPGYLYFSNGVVILRSFLNVIFLYRIFFFSKKKIFFKKKIFLEEILLRLKKSFFPLGNSADILTTTLYYWKKIIWPFRFRCNLATIFMNHLFLVYGASLLSCKRCLLWFFLISCSKTFALAPSFKSTGNSSSLTITLKKSLWFFPNWQTNLK